MRARIALLLLLCFGLLAPAAHAQPGKPRIVVVLKAGTSKGPLAPYEKAAKAFRAVLQPEAEVLIEPGSLSQAVSSVQAGKPDLIVAFGTEAAQFAEKNFPSLPRVVALAPGAGAPSDDGAPCTMITPEISPELQMKWIDETLPDVKAVGVIFDPRASQRRMDELIAAAKARPDGVEVVPIPVSAETEVPAAFTAFKKNRKASETALLFIPDRTVNTGGTLSYLFKESLAAAIPVIGFNSWFADNGAVLSFAVDYAAVGTQAAQAAKALPVDGPGWVEGPKKVTVWVNQRVADKIKVRTDYDPDKVQEIH
jgi:ABC-type uncharacterized transport system substrate-binding protein